MRRAIRTGVALLVAMLTASSAPAAARSARPQRGDAPPLDSSETASACRKMCPQDAAPCDPTYYKTADGRCAGILTR